MVEDRIQTFFLTIERAGTEHRAEHFPRAGRMLDHGSFRCQIAPQNCDTAIFTDRLTCRTDDITAGQLQTTAGVCLIQKLLAMLVESILFEVFQIFAQRFSGNGHGVKMENITDLFHNCRNTARIIEELCGPAACRTNIQQIFCAAMEPVKRVTIDLDPELVRDRRQMQQCVRRTRNCRMDQNCVFKTIHRNNVAGTDPLIGQCDCLTPRTMRIADKIRTGRRQQCTSRERKTQSLRHDLHGRSGSDKTARTTARAGVLLCPIQL